MKIYNLGSLNIDYVYSVEHFVTGGETISSRGLSLFPGGKGLNQSIALARAGAPVIHGGICGTGGDFLINTLQDAGVDTTRIKRSEDSNGHAIIQVNSQGENCIMIHPGTNGMVDATYIEEYLRDASEGDILLLQNEVSGLADAFEIAHSKGMTLVFNPSPYSVDLCSLPLSYVDIWFVNEIEGGAITGTSDPYAIADAFMTLYPEARLVLTLGDKGSIYRDKDTAHVQTAYRAVPVDTTAAGDTFTGYFMSYLTSAHSVKDSMNAASLAASITVSRMGAAESIPDISEVEKLL